MYDVPFQKKSSSVQSKKEDSIHSRSTESALYKQTNDDSPTVNITAYASNTINSSFTVVFSFSKSIQNFDLSDVIVSNGTSSVFNKVSNVRYTARITPIKKGTVTIQIPANAVQDLSDNNNASSNIFTIVFDSTPPIVLITSNTTNPTNVSCFDATFTFSEGMDDFDPSYFSVTNATVSNFVSVNSAVYTVTITPIMDGTVTISVATDETEDFAGNTNTAAEYSIQVDTVKPTVDISSTTVNPTNETFTSSFTFSEAVNGFAKDNLTLNNATASNFTATSGSVYTALITPTTDGVVSIDIDAGVATDAATNTNTAAVQFTTNYDITTPTVTISSSSANSTNDVFMATFTFSEAVNGFVEGDLTLNNATTSNFTATSTTVYTALITQTADGTVRIDIAAGTANDAATNANTAATTFVIIYDTTPPSAPLIIDIDSYTCASSTTTTADAILVFSVTAAANSLVELFVNSTSIGTTTATSNGTWSFDYMSGWNRLKK